MLNGQWLHVIRPLSSITRSEDVVIFTHKYVYIYILIQKKCLRWITELLSSSPVFSGVLVIRSLVLCVCFVDRWLSFFFWPLCCLFVCDVRFWLPLWYLQTLLVLLVKGWNNIFYFDSEIVHRQYKVIV